MRSPWNGGSIALRRERCSAPSSSSTERGAHDRLEREAAPRRQAVLAAGVERADRLGVGDHHHRRLKAEELDAERVAVAAPAGVEELDRPKQPARGLNAGGADGPGGSSCALAPTKDLHGVKVA